MNMRRAIIGLTLLGVAAGFNAAKAGPMELELGAKYNVLENESGLLTRMREYRSLPEDGVFSRARFEYGLFGESNRLQFFGRNFGDDDAEATLYAALDKIASLEATYARVPHLLDGSGAYGTQRNTENYKLSLAPLGVLSAVIETGEQDKTGRLSPTNWVGQKDETLSGEIRARLGSVQAAVGGRDDEFNENNANHDVSGTNASVSWDPSRTAYGVFTFRNRELEPKSRGGAAVKALEFTESSFRTGFQAMDGLKVSASYANKKRENPTAGALAMEDDVFAFGLDHSCKLGKASVKYTKTERDYVNGSVASRETESVRVKGSTRFNHLDLKADYGHAYRDVEEIAGSTVYTFEGLNGESHDRSFTIQTVGFSKVGLSYTSKRKADQHDPNDVYGTTSNVSIHEGLTANYFPDDRFVMTVSSFTVESRLEGRQKFWSKDAASGLNTPLDVTLATYSNTDYFTIGGSYVHSADVDVSLNYTLADSTLSDPHGSNAVEEKTLELSVNRALGPHRSVGFSYTWNSYEDALDSTFHKGDDLFEVEAIQRF